MSAQEYLDDSLLSLKPLWGERGCCYLVSDETHIQLIDLVEHLIYTLLMMPPRLWNVLNLEVFRNYRICGEFFLYQPQISNCHLLGLIKVASMQCGTRGAKKIQLKARGTAKQGKYINTFRINCKIVSERIRNNCKFISEEISQLGLQIISEMKSYRIYIHSTTQDGLRHRKKNIVLCAKVCP